MSRKVSFFFALAVVFAVAPAAKADPLLQLYIQGATYNNSSETWVFNGSGTFTLWAIGNVDGPGGKGTISNVQLVANYTHGLAPTISLTSSKTNGYLGYADPSTPGAPVFVKTSTTGTEIPKLGDGSDLPSHGEYGSNTDWKQWALGDFNLTDSQCGDFMTSAPTATGSKGCQINVYTITVTGATNVHFDLFDHVQAGNKANYVFAPFSHDAEDNNLTRVPEPASLALLGTGLVGAGSFFRRKLIR